MLDHSIWTVVEKPSQVRAMQRVMLSPLITLSTGARYEW